MVAPGGMRGCSGGCAWLLWGACMVAPGGGHVWLLQGGMHGCSGGACNMKSLQIIGAKTRCIFKESHFLLLPNYNGK